MRQDEVGRWLSDDGRWVWNAEVGQWRSLVPAIPPPGETDAPDAALGRPSPVAALVPDPPAWGRAPSGPLPGESASPAPDEAETAHSSAGELPPVAQIVLTPPPRSFSAADAAGGTGAHRAQMPLAERWPRLNPRAIATAAAFLVVVVIAALVLTRCGGGGSASRAATARPAPASPSSAPAFPASARSAYLDACVGTTPERRAFCTCTLGELQRTMTWEQFRTVGQAATAGDPAARQRYAAAVVACADQVPR